MKKLSFKPFSDFSKGLIYEMLLRSYASFPKLVKQDKKSWRSYDRSVFDHLEGGIGKSGFVTCIGEIPIGFASWDPRNKPDFAILGHNCILPEFQRKGYGKAQIKEVLRRLEKLGFAKVKVSTGIGCFFIPSEKMYRSCGFRESKRERHKTKADLEIIHFEKLLTRN